MNIYHVYSGHNDYFVEAQNFFEAITIFKSNFDFSDIWKVEKVSFCPANRHLITVNF